MPAVLHPGLIRQTFTFTKLCSPNEDFGRPKNKPFRTHFLSTFQRFVAQIMYSHPWKVLKNRTVNGLFGLPKSSFGRGKVEKSVEKAGFHLLFILPKSSFGEHKLWPTWTLTRLSHHTPLNTTGTHGSSVDTSSFYMLSSSCDFDIHIVMMSSLAASILNSCPPNRLTKILDGLTKDEIQIFRYTFQWFVAQI